MKRPSDVSSLSGVSSSHTVAPLSKEHATLLFLLSLDPSLYPTRRFDLRKIRPSCIVRSSSCQDVPLFKERDPHEMVEKMSFLFRIRRRPRKPHADQLPTFFFFSFCSPFSGSPCIVKDGPFSVRTNPFAIHCPPEMSDSPCSDSPSLGIFFLRSN